MGSVIYAGDKALDLSVAQVMGILNVTPDSFSDGGLFRERNKAIEQACRMEEAGAAIIDVGGESTRPGAEKVSVQQELDRVIPIVEELTARLDCWISVDTSTPEVISAAAQAGASMINDVRALRREGALEAAVRAGLPVALMHMQGEPDTMQSSPYYQNVVIEVLSFLQHRIEACIAAGLAADQLLVDPGFGFGKTLEHNLALLANLESFKVLKRPILVGISRKSMLGAITGKSVSERLSASLAAALLAIERGASLVRVHDVEETVDAVKMINAIRSAVVK